MASLVLLSYRRLSYKKACIPQSLNLKFTKIDKREVLIRSGGNVQNIISGVRVGWGEGAITDFWNLWPKNGKILMEKKRACTLYHSFSSFRPNRSFEDCNVYCLRYHLIDFFYITSMSSSSSLSFKNAAKHERRCLSNTRFFIRKSSIRKYY